MDQEMYKITEEIIYPVMQVFQDQLGLLLQNQEKTCYTGSVDSEIFVDCMVKTHKKLEKQQKRFEFQMVHLKNDLQVCFEQKQEQAFCQALAQKQISAYVEQFLNKVK